MIGHLPLWGSGDVVAGAVFAAPSFMASSDFVPVV
jgi:hypothetical protein